MSPRTVLAYAQSWRNFERWCSTAGRSMLPASEDTVSLFLTWCLEVKGSRLETVRLAVSSIRSRHREADLPCPIGDAVRLLIRSAARQRCESPQGKTAMTPEQVRTICRALERHPSLLEIRDRALLLVGFTSGCRRSELAALQLADVEFVVKGLSVRIGRSKTDQLGKGRIVGLPMGAPSTCPVRAMRAWVRARGDWRGPLFCRIGPHDDLCRAPLRPEAVNNAIKRLLVAIGVDAAPYGAHSLRAGLATAAAENGASSLSIMRRAGWKSVHTVLRYVRPVEAFASNPLAGVL